MENQRARGSSREGAERVVVPAAVTLLLAATILDLALWQKAEWLFESVLFSKMTGAAWSAPWTLGLAYSCASFLVWYAYYPTFRDIRKHGKTVTPLTWAMFGATNTVGLSYAAVTGNVPLMVTRSPATAWCAAILVAHFMEKRAWSGLDRVTRALSLRFPGSADGVEAVRMRMKSSLLAVRHREDPVPPSSDHLANRIAYGFRCFAHSMASGLFGGRGDRMMAEASRSLEEAVARGDDAVLSRAETVIRAVDAAEFSR